MRRALAVSLRNKHQPLLLFFDAGAGACQVSQRNANRVISQNYDDRVTTDAGIKAFASDKPKHLPEVKGVTGVTMGYGGDKHGILTFNQPSRAFKVGDRVELIVPHCDPNVNLYDRLYCTRGERVVEVWWTVGRYGD